MTSTLGSSSKSLKTFFDGTAVFRDINFNGSTITSTAAELNDYMTEVF